MKGATFPFWSNPFCAPVSIHAPMKGATGSRTTHIRHGPVSIHAPMKGATLIFILSFFINICFNPRSHEGSDSNFSQKSSLFSAKINNLFLHYKLFFLLSLFFLQKPLDFVHIYRCESPCIFMFNPYSHTLILS